MQGVVREKEDKDDVEAEPLEQDLRDPEQAFDARAPGLFTSSLVSATS